MQEALQADLQDAQAAVHDEDQRRQQEGERVAALERQHREEEAHGAAARVTHQQGGGLGIHPQVGQQCADEDDGGGAVVGQLFVVGDQVGADGHHRQTGGQAVHTVGAVDHVDAGPDQDDDEQQIHRIGQGEGMGISIYNQDFDENNMNVTVDGKFKFWKSENAILVLKDDIEERVLNAYRINDLNNLLFLGDDFVGIEFKNLNQEEMIEIKNSKCLL